MRKYKISCDWQVCAVVEIEANSLTEAVAIVEASDFPLPTDNSYIDGSFSVNAEMTLFLNERLT